MTARYLAPLGERTFVARLPGGPARSLKSQHTVAAITFVLIAALSVTGFAWASSTVTLVVDGDIRKVRTHAGDVGELLSEEGVKIRDADLVDPAPSSPLADGMTLTVVRAVPVVLDLGGERLKLDVVGTTVADALESAGLQNAKGIRVAPAPDSPLRPNMTVRATDVFVRVREKEEAVPFKKVLKRDRSLEPGERKVVSKGLPGKKMLIYQVLVINGDEGTPVLRAAKVVRAPVREVVRVGFKPRKAVQVAPGRKSPVRTKASRPRAYKIPAAPKGGRPLKVHSSAYAPGHGCGTRTASGRRAGRGVIAVDPKVIPMGTRVYIPRYGYAVAADIGSAIKGKRIDICFDTEAEARAWGRRSVTIKILP